ncbi:MAG: C-type lectin domain-containing protein [Deltaproteobacteria bacterium]|nr:C-type lectin domain-containing protein [Deltaproteobacteria bacterium]
MTKSSLSLVIAIGACGGGNTIPVDAAIDAYVPPCGLGDQQVRDASTGQCYEVYRMQALDWPAARVACRTAGGDLATISTVAENNLISSVVGAGGLYFIGGSIQEGAWAWSSGEPMTFTHWGTGKPDSGRDNDPGTGTYPAETCLVLDANMAGRWNDFPCVYDIQARTSGTLAYVCERRAPP